MLTKSYLDGDTFVIEKTFLNIFLKLIFVCTLASLLGLGFVKVGTKNNDILFEYFGYLLILICIFCLVAMPYKSLKRKGRDILRANYKGLTIFKDTVGVKKMFYAWEDVLMILLTKKLLTKHENGKGWSWNDLIIFIKNREDIESFGPVDIAQNYIGESPEGGKFIHLSFNKKDIDITLKYLKEFSGNKFEINHYKELVFDYENKKIEYKP